MNFYTEKNMRLLMNFLDTRSYVNNGTQIDSTFRQEAYKRGIDLNADFMNRKCSLNQNEINFILKNEISQYITVPYSIIDKNHRYKLNQFKFYNIINIINNYDNYDNIYNIAYSQSQLKKGIMIYLSCYKHTNDFMFRTETINQIAQFSDKKNIKITFPNVILFKYSEALVKIYQNNI